MFNMLLLLRNWGIAIWPRCLWFVDNRKKSKLSYSEVSVSKGTGGIAISAANNWKTNICAVSLIKWIVGIVNL